MKVPREGYDTKCCRCGEQFDPADGGLSSQPDDTILELTFGAGAGLAENWPGAAGTIRIEDLCPRCLGAVRRAFAHMVKDLDWLKSHAKPREVKP